MTFQLAPVYQNRITVVVTPLLALGKDQASAGAAHCRPALLLRR